MRPLELKHCRGGVNMANRFQGLNMQALRRLLVPVDIPNPNLGVDMASVKQSINFDYFPPVQKPPVTTGIYAIEEVTMDGNGNPVQSDLFPNTGYYGDVLGSLGGDFY